MRTSDAHMGEATKLFRLDWLDFLQMAVAMVWHTRLCLLKSFEIQIRDACASLEHCVMDTARNFGAHVGPGPGEALPSHCPVAAAVTRLVCVMCIVSVGMTRKKMRRRTSCLRR